MRVCKPRGASRFRVCGGVGQVPLHAITHHEYIEVDPDPVVPPTAGALNITDQITFAVNETLAATAPGVQIWAGEIGPHNGGSPPCDHGSMRWANFGDSFWYLDAMGTKAAGGYSVFCRQDFIGADYGMLDCATESPLPDYYAGILWSKLMGAWNHRHQSSGCHCLSSRQRWRCQPQLASPPPEAEAVCGPGLQYNYSGQQLLLPPAKWCPIFASRTTQESV